MDDDLTAAFAAYHDQRKTGHAYRRMTLLLRIAPGERWCRNCGETFDGDICHRCECAESVPAARVLRPGEYVCE